MATLVAFLDDLMFLSRIRELVRPLGVDLVAVRKVEPFLAECRKGPLLVVLDLDSDRLPRGEALKGLENEGLSIPLLGFYSHVHPERAVECPSVPRSAFFRELASRLGGPRES